MNKYTCMYIYIYTSTQLAADGTSVSAETKDGGGLGGGMTSLESPPSGAPLGASDATSPTPQKKSWWKVW